MSIGTARNPAEARRETLTVAPEDVFAAAARIAGHVTTTPVLSSAALDERVAARTLVKAEVLQRTSSFKYRGAYNRLSQLTPEQRTAGVVAFSSGNHAQAIAAAAELLSMSAAIVMPSDAPAIKLAKPALRARRWCSTTVMPRTGWRSARRWHRRGRRRWSRPSMTPTSSPARARSASRRASGGGTRRLPGSAALPLRRRRADRRREPRVLRLQPGDAHLFRRARGISTIRAARWRAGPCGGTRPAAARSAMRCLRMSPGSSPLPSTGACWRAASRPFA